ASRPTYDTTQAVSHNGTQLLGNDTAALTHGTFTVNKKAASVTATDASKTYGATEPTLGTTNSGFVAGDLGATKITFSASRAAGESASPPTYDITPAVSDNGTGLLNNYTVRHSPRTITSHKNAASVTAC